ncbi:MAG: thioredoxin [Bdellovibrionales bacterium]|nr:thioredoxin [Bdellovibrionales bacterium]
MSHTFTVCPKCKSLNKLSIEKATANQAVCGKCGNNLVLHGLVSEVNTEDFRRIIKSSDKPVVVDFWASWCGPCKTYGPEYEKASKENYNAVFLKISTEQEQQLSQELGIRGIPCTILFKNGKEVARQAGVMSSMQVKQFVNSVT